MSRIVFFLFSRFPILETIFRCAIEKNIHVKKIFKKIYETSGKNHNTPVGSGDNWEEFKIGIKNIGIKSGDIVLVHSSMDGLGVLGVEPRTIIDYLLSLVGEEGTIVFPTYPLYSAMVRAGKRHGNIPLYDPKKTLPWTGVLPLNFLSYDEVERSLFPHNSLAAKGKAAKEMMKSAFEGTYSQDKYSPWNYLVENNAKILYLGVEASTSCTIVHYAEDIMGEQYPVRDWYIKETYAVRTSSGIEEKEIFTRNEEWYKYYKMFNTGYWMKKKGFLKEYKFGKAYVGYTDNIKGLTDELVQNARRGKLTFNIPKRYRKKVEKND